MDMHQFEAVAKQCWTLKASHSSAQPIRLFGSEALIKQMDDKVLEQILNVSQLPGLVGCAMTMPDAHWGYGFPIGGVAAFDAEQSGVISAGGVGFDISCGIRCLRSNMDWQDLFDARETIADQLFNHIPAGVGVEGQIKLNPSELDAVLVGGAKWAVTAGFGERADLAFIEENGVMADANPETVSLLAKQRQRGEMGTLGSGNHYLELQQVEKIFDSQAAEAFGLHMGQVLISIHCGSRGLGHQIGSDYLLRFAKCAGHYGIDLPDRELACAPIQSSDGQQYLGAMHAGINCALANRQILTQITRDCLASILPGIRIETLYDVSHNTCKREVHTVAGKKRELYIHRKGATRAFGPHHPDLPTPYQSVGQPVIIGGSMGTRSYILAGNPDSLNQAFASASHGAGRAMSRHQAIKHWRGRHLLDELAQAGILVRSRSMRGVAEEAPAAYKDVDEVAESTESAGLARRVVSLKPFICVKG